MTSIYDAPRTRAESWTEAGLNFAGTMMILLGMFQGLEGLTALIDENFYAGVPEYAYDISVGAWAWIHLIMALLLIIAGFALFAGSRVAAGVAMALAGLSCCACSPCGRSRGRASSPAEPEVVRAQAELV